MVTASFSASRLRCTVFYCMNPFYSVVPSWAMASLPRHLLTQCYCTAFTVPHRTCHRDRCRPAQGKARGVLLEERMPGPAGASDEGEACMRRHFGLRGCMRLGPALSPTRGCRLDRFAMCVAQAAAGGLPGIVCFATRGRDMGCPGKLTPLFRLASWVLVRTDLPSTRAGGRPPSRALPPSFPLLR